MLDFIEKYDNLFILISFILMFLFIILLVFVIFRNRTKKQKEWPYQELKSVKKEEKLKVAKWKFLKGKFSLSFIRDRLKAKYSRDTLIINMQIAPNEFESFVVSEKDDKFTYKHGQYVIDKDLMEYNKSFRMNMLNYVKGVSIPIKKAIDKEAIKQSIINQDQDIQISINSNSLKQFVKRKISEGVMESGFEDIFLKKIQFIMYIVLGVTAIHFLLFVYGSGMLQNIKIPGL